MNRNTFIKQFHKFQFNREQHFAPKLKKALNAQYLQFLTAKKHGLGNDHALQTISSNGVHQVLRAIYLDSIHYGSLIFSQLPKAPKKTKRRAPIGFNEEMIQLINTYFATDILNFSEGITDTTKEKIKEILQQATLEGQGLQWIVDNIQAQSDELNPSRSRLIARTETVTATNQAGHIAAAKTGLMMKKEWLSTLDSRTRVAHMVANGQTVNFEDYFHVGGETLLSPGARVQSTGLPTSGENVINCRCVELHIPVRNSSGALIEHDYGILSAVDL